MPIDLTLRSETGVPITAVQNDQNLTTIQDFVNGLEAGQGVALNADGTLKDGSVSTPAKLAAGIVTLAKLFSPGVALANRLLYVDLGGNISIQHALSFSASKALSDQSFVGGSAAAIVSLDFLEWDDSPAFASNRFTVPAGNLGRFDFFGGVEISLDSGSPTNIEFILFLMKSGAIADRMSVRMAAAPTGFTFLKVAKQITLADGDEVHLEIQITDTGASTYKVLADPRYTYLTGHKVR